MSESCDVAAPVAAERPYHTAANNRYLTFDANNLADVALEVELLAGPGTPGVLGWVGQPNVNGVSRIVDTPYFATAWPGVVLLGDCGIVPDALYAIRATTGGPSSPSLLISTIAKPEPNFWGDVVGSLVPMDPLDPLIYRWSDPDGVTDEQDVDAVLLGFVNRWHGADVTWLDVEGEVPNYIVNINDVLRVIQASQGNPYPFSDPDGCCLENTTEGGGDSPAPQMSTNVTLRLDNEWQASQKNKVGLGFQVTRSDIRYDFVRDDTLTILDRNQDALQAVAYLQDTWKPFARLDLTAGLRAVYYDLTEESFIEPRLSFILGLSDRIKFKGAYGQYHQFVARVVNENITEGARDFWLLADGETVGVAGSTHYILGASYEAPDWLFDVEGYYKDLTQLTEFSLRYQRSAGQLRPRAGAAGIEADELFFTGDGVAKGLEFLLQKKTGRHTGWISYTLSEVEHTFPELNGGEPFPALHDQTHELKIVNSLNLRRWTLAATWTFATGKPYTSPESQYFITLLDGTEQSFIHVGEKNSKRLPAYHRFDAAVHYKFDVGASGVDVGFSVFNLYNRSNVWYKEFDLTESPMVTTDVRFLGFTPNLSVRVDL